MTEQELMEKIRLSAEEIEIPEEISPESMKEKLKTAAQGKKKRRYAGKNIAVAAALLVVCGISVSVTYRTMQGNHAQSTAEDAAGLLTGASDVDMVEQEGAVADSAADEASVAEAVAAPKRDAGELYVVAENYGDIYDALEKGYAGYDLEEEMARDADGAAAVSVQVAQAATDSAVKEAYEEEPYSKTNLQTEGVDESDIIKTDGSYLYIVKDNAVKIIDIQGSGMEEAGTIEISLNSAADRVVEMYVDGDKLNLIVEREQTQLSQNTVEEEQQIDGEEAAAEGSAIRQMAAADVEYYYIQSETVTELQTYDISGRKNPVLEGSITQDGSYYTSRKIGQVVYLFTRESIQKPDLAREQAVLEENTGSWIPLVNGTAVAADCIYIPEYGNNGLVISSVNVDNPDKIVDNTLIINNYVSIYVSTEALYLYGQDFSGGGVVTQIAKFGLTEGVIDAIGATSAAGVVYDTFAINEYQGTLRLLTTDWSQAEDENNLYLFDENLNLTGSLTGIAIGEDIYAARYLGDIAYFVTYRNTDPLFAVDLSDETNPRIISELEITGFSEYLHFWGEDKLLGIGYETDPDTGAQEGIKLTMFDISEPAELKILGTCVIENLHYSPACSNYKCVLADAGENVIGFAASTYAGVDSCSYLLFSWENGKFKELMTETVSQYSALDSYRGLYVGDIFYLASPEAVTSYDREQQYKLLENLEL